MIITISGRAGSGKSTVAKNIAKKLNAERIYVGGIRREIARERGMSIQELNEYAKTHPDTDVDVDEKAAAQARGLEKEGKVVVVEGRPQFHFLPESIKVFMDVDVHEAAKRVWSDLQDSTRSKERNEKAFENLADVEKGLLERDANDAHRYMKYYNVDHRDLKHYDLVVDTTNISAKEAAKKVLDFVKQQ